MLTTLLPNIEGPTCYATPRGTNALGKHAKAASKSSAALPSKAT